MVYPMWKVSRVLIPYANQHHGFVKPAVRASKIRHANSVLTEAEFLKRQMSENGFI